MLNISVAVLLAFLTPPAEEPVDIAALYNEAVAKNKAIASWYYFDTASFSVGGQRVAGQRGWHRGDQKTKPGDIFRITVSPSLMAPVFKVSQITGPKSFLDFDNKLLVEGIETDGLVDGTVIHEPLLSKKVATLRDRTHTRLRPAPTPCSILF